MFPNFLRKIIIKNTIHRSAYTYNICNILDTIGEGEVVTIKGWIKSLRKQKENVFIDVSDGSTVRKLQIIVAQNIFPKNATTGSSISSSGVIQNSPNGEKELNVKEIKVYNDCIVSNGYPFAPRTKYSVEYIRQHLHFRPRTNKFASLLRTRSAAQLNFHKYLTSQNYVNIQTPILTSNDCEGGGEVFKVVPDKELTVTSMIKEGKTVEEAFFNKKTFLSVSGQLHLEAAAHGLTRVYNLGPIFRAENSRSRLHLTEFYMLEAEIGFIEEIEILISTIEDLVKNVTKLVLENCQNDIYACQEDVKLNFDWLHKKFVVLTYDEAKSILNKNQFVFENGFQENRGFSKEHELFLVKYCGNVPTFVINWPKNMKPFYMRECKEDTSKVHALDLLVPGVGEMVGGSLRENDPGKLKERLPQDNDHLDWYIDIRKFGGVPTAGYGLGFERYLLFLTGIQNIKDVIPFPRWPHNCSM